MYITHSKVSLVCALFCPPATPWIWSNPGRLGLAGAGRPWLPSTLRSSKALVRFFYSVYSTPPPSLPTCGTLPCNTEASLSFVLVYLYMCICICVFVFVYLYLCICICAVDCPQLWVFPLSLATWRSSCREELRNVAEMDGGGEMEEKLKQGKLLPQVKRKISNS